MASRAAQRVADELTDIGYQVFPDISWVYNKPLHISGPRTASDYALIEEKVLGSQTVELAIEDIYNTSGIPLNRLRAEFDIHALAGVFCAQVLALGVRRSVRQHGRLVAN